MAKLWVATNESTGAEVCVKLLVPDPDKRENDREAVERFRREAHAAARLSHRAIVRVFDLLELDEAGQAIPHSAGRMAHAYAIVMELLRGETLGDVLAKRGKMSLEQALDVFLPIVSALGHAHRADVVHRDLKPDNIFLAEEPDGHVVPKVLDFGVSKLGTAPAITIDGVLVGTPSFMSPEQAKGARQIDARSDVFSAGILLYVMLSGRNPFGDAPTFAAMVDAVLRRHVPRLADVPPAIWEVIDRAIAKDPVQRFADGTEMSIALRKAAGRRTATESDPTIPVPPPSSRRAVAPAPMAPSAGSSGAGSSSRSGAPALIGPTSALEGGSLGTDGASRRRAIVAGIVGAAAAIAVAAGILTVVGRRERTAPSATIPGRSAPSVARAAEPPAAPTTIVSDPGPVVAGGVGAAPDPVASPPGTTSVKLAVSAARPAAVPRRPAAGSARVPAPRLPGQEPHNARDPGF